MKKKYIRPESQLFVINLTENIAESSTIEEEEFFTDVLCKVYYKPKSDGHLYYSDFDGALVRRPDHPFADVMDYITQDHMYWLGSCLKY